MCSCICTWICPPPTTPRSAHQGGGTKRGHASVSGGGQLQAQGISKGSRTSSGSGPIPKYATALVPPQLRGRVGGGGEACAHVAMDHAHMHVVCTNTCVYALTLLTRARACMQRAHADWSALHCIHALMVWRCLWKPYTMPAPGHMEPSALCPHVAHALCVHVPLLACRPM